MLLQFQIYEYQVLSKENQCLNGDDDDNDDKTGGGGKRGGGVKRKRSPGSGSVSHFEQLILALPGGPSLENSNRHVMVAKTSLSGHDTKQQAGSIKEKKKKHKKEKGKERVRENDLSEL